MSIWSTIPMLSLGYRWKNGDGNDINVWKDPWNRTRQNLWPSSIMSINFLLWLSLNFSIQQLTLEIATLLLLSWTHKMHPIFVSYLCTLELILIQLFGMHLLMAHTQSNLPTWCVWAFQTKGQTIMSLVIGSWYGNCVFRLKLNIFVGYCFVVAYPRGLIYKVMESIASHLVWFANIDLEDEMHMFMHCRFATDCWKEANFWDKIELYMMSSGTFSSNIFAILRVLEMDNRARFVAILWSIWRTRNVCL